MTVRKYELTPYLGHSSGPDTWIVWSTVISRNEDGDPVSDTEMICHGLTLKESLAQIELMEEVMK